MSEQSIWIVRNNRSRTRASLRAFTFISRTKWNFKILQSAQSSLKFQVLLYIIPVKVVSEGCTDSLSYKMYVHKKEPTQPVGE